MNRNAQARINLKLYRVDYKSHSAQENDSPGYALARKELSLSKVEELARVWYEPSGKMKLREVGILSIGNQELLEGFLRKKVILLGYARE